MKYLAIVYGRGEGCDYTVGCNVAIHELDAETMDEAIAEVSNFEGDEGDICGYYGDERVDHCEIIEVSNVVDFMEIHNDGQRKINETERIKQEEEDKKLRKAEYEKLKKEFEEK